MVSKLLSVIADRWQGSIRERTSAEHLLRPIFINGVEVGFAHVRPDEENKKLSVRGVTIALWHFLSRGHQAQALMPFCFKTYPNKSDNWNELMALFRLNLVEFTPGYGSDKYVEVNRIIAMRGREYGGCMVARSQMQSIVEEQPLLEAIVERRLLIPSFNGNDLIFPVDGPLGRNGPNLSQTLECTTKDPEFARCALQQMTLQDQRLWLTAISALASNMAGWTLLAEQVRGYQLKGVVMQPRKPAQSVFGSFQLHPPETNPPDNRGFSVQRIRRWGQRRVNFSKSPQSDPVYYNYNYRRSSDSRERSARYINTNVTVHNDERARQNTESDNGMRGERGNTNTQNDERHEASEDSVRSSVKGGAPATSTKNVQNADRVNDSRKRPSDSSSNAQSSTHFTHLAAVFGWNKAKSVCDKHPDINNVCALAQLLLEEEERSVTETERTSSGDDHQAEEAQGQVLPDSAGSSAGQSASERNDEQEHTAQNLDSSQIQTETDPEQNIAAPTSNISFDLISFAAVPAFTPPQVDGHVQEAHAFDHCADLIQL